MNLLWDTIAMVHSLWKAIVICSIITILMGTVAYHEGIGNLLVKPTYTHFDPKNIENVGSTIYFTLAGEKYAEPGVQKGR